MSHIWPSHFLRFKRINHQGNPDGCRLPAMGLQRVRVSCSHGGNHHDLHGGNFYGNALVHPNLDGSSALATAEDFSVVHLATVVEITVVGLCCGERSPAIEMDGTARSLLFHR